MNKFKTFLLLLISFVLQTSIFSKIDIFGANINIIIPAIIALSQILPGKTASYGALLVGLVEDFLLTSLVGVRALSYFLISYVASGNVAKLSKDKMTGCISTFISSIFNFVLVNVIYYIFGKSLISISSYLPMELLIESLLNAMIYFIYYMFIKKIMYIPTYRI